jgi:hypothetical protein
MDHPVTHSRQWRCSGMPVDRFQHLRQRHLLR